MSAHRATSWPFLRLYVLAFLFFSANAVLNVIVPIRSESMGASNTIIGFIMGTYMLTCMFFRPWAGFFVHKYGPVKILRLLLVINGSALLLYTVTGLEGFFVARFLQGMTTAFFSMALQLGIMDALPEEERSQGVSLYSLFTYMPTIVGPLIALGIWEWGGINSFTAVMIFIAVFTGLFGYNAAMKPPESAIEEKEQQPAGMLKAMRQMFSHPPLFVCSVLMLTASVVFGSVSVFIPLYASEVAYGNAGIYFMLQASVIVASRFFLRKQIPSDGGWHPRFIVSILLGAALGAILLSLSAAAGPLFFYSSALLMGMAQALLYPTLVTYLTFVLSSASRNVLIGLFIASADLGISLGGAAMGPIADAVSYSVLYSVCSGLMFVMAGFALGYRKRLSQPAMEHGIM